MSRRATVLFGAMVAPNVLASGMGRLPDSPRRPEYTVKNLNTLPDYNQSQTFDINNFGHVVLMMHPWQASRDYREGRLAFRGGKERRMRRGILLLAAMAAVVLLRTGKE
jgi:hypothetical protein